MNFVDYIIIAIVALIIGSCVVLIVKDVRRRKKQ